jgi:hypothetical protein
MWSTAPENARSALRHITVPRALKARVRPTGAPSSREDATFRSVPWTGMGATGRTVAALRIRAADRVWFTATGAANSPLPAHARFYRSAPGSRCCRTTRKQHWPRPADAARSRRWKFVANFFRGTRLWMSVITETWQQ